MKKKYILHGKWAEMEEMDSKKHSSTRRGNTKKKDGASVRMSATSRRNTKKKEIQRSGLSAISRLNTKKRQRSGQGDCRQLDDVIRRRGTGAGVGMSSTRRRNTKKSRWRGRGDAVN